MARICRYCACGATLVGHVNPDRLAEGLAEAWAAVHDSPECGPATPVEASNARRRARRAEVAGRG